MDLRTFFLFLTLIFATQSILADEKGISSENPFAFGASYVGEGLSVLQGGLQTGQSYEGMANLRFSFLSDHTGWWKGGSFLVTLANTHGGMPSSNLIGDFQVVSNIEAGNLTYLHECWYRQELGSWTIIAGLQDLNSEFVGTESGSLFLNSSFGTHSTIASNVPSPIFPLTSLGAQIQYLFASNWMVKLAFFDGMPENMDSNPHNVSWHLNSQDGYLAFAELEKTNLLPCKTNGRFSFGAYYHNHQQFSSSMENYGVYLTADQAIIKHSSGSALNAFLQLAISPASKNDNNWYLGGGIHYSGLFINRLKDEFGLGFAHAGLQNSANGNETTLEMTYKFKCFDRVFFQPDLQYIIHPAGTTGAPEDALAAILRFGIEF